MCDAISWGEIGWPWMRTQASPLGAATIRNGASRANHDTSSALTLRPISRLAPNTVAAALVTPWRRARAPTATWPDSAQLTHDGTMRSPSAPDRIRGWPLSSSTATHELVVPRSMPMMRDIRLRLLLAHQAAEQALALVGGLATHLGELARGALVRRIDLERGLEPLRRLQPIARGERQQALAQLDAGARVAIAGRALAEQPVPGERLVEPALIDQIVQRVDLAGLDERRRGLVLGERSRGRPALGRRARRCHRARRRAIAWQAAQGALERR